MSTTRPRRSNSLVRLADAWSAQSLDATSAAPPGFGRSTLLSDIATKAAIRKENIMGPNFNAGFVKDPPRNPSWRERSKPRNPLRFYTDHLPIVAMARRDQNASVRVKSLPPMARTIGDNFGGATETSNRRPSFLSVETACTKQGTPLCTSPTPFTFTQVDQSFVGDPQDGGFKARLGNPEHPLYQWIMDQTCPHEIHTFLFNQEGKKYAFSPQSIVDLGQEAWRDYNREMIKWACPVGNMLLHFWCVHQYLIKLSDPEPRKYDDVDGLNEQLRLQGWYQEIRKEEEGCVDCPRSLSYYCDEEHKFRMVKAWHVMNESLYAYNAQLKKLGELEDKTASFVANLTLAEQRLNASERAHAHQQARILPIINHDMNRLATFDLARAEESLHYIINVSMPPIVNNFTKTSESLTAAEEALSVAVRTTREANDTLIETTRRLHAMQERLPHLIEEELPNREKELQQAKQIAEVTLSAFHAACNGSEISTIRNNLKAASAAYQSARSEMESAEAALALWNESIGIQELIDKKTVAAQKLNETLAVAIAADEEIKGAGAADPRDTVSSAAIQTEECAKHDSLRIKRSLAEQEAIEAREAQDVLAEKSTEASLNASSAATEVRTAKAQGTAWQAAREAFLKANKTYTGATENLTNIHSQLEELVAAKATASTNVDELASSLSRIEKEIGHISGELTEVLETIDQLEIEADRLTERTQEQARAVEELRSKLNEFRDDERDKVAIEKDLLEVTERIESFRETLLSIEERGRESQESMTLETSRAQLTTSCLAAGIRKALSWVFRIGDDSKAEVGSANYANRRAMNVSNECTFEQIECESAQNARDSNDKLADNMKMLISSAERTKQGLEEELVVERRRSELTIEFNGSSEQLHRSEIELQDVVKRKNDAHERSEALTSRQSELTRKALAYEKNLEVAKDTLRDILLTVTNAEGRSDEASVVEMEAADALAKAREELERYAVLDGIVMAEEIMTDREECLNRTVLMMEKATAESRTKHERLSALAEAARAASEACHFGDSDLREAEAHYRHAESEARRATQNQAEAEEKFDAAAESLTTVMGTSQYIELDGRLKNATHNMTICLEQLRTVKKMEEEANAECERATVKMEEAHAHVISLNDTVVNLLDEKIAVKKGIEDEKIEILRAARSLEEAETYEEEKLRKALKWRARHAEVEQALEHERQKQYRAMLKVNETMIKVEEVHRRLGYRSVEADFQIIRNTTMSHRLEVWYQRGNLTEHREIYANETQKAWRLRNELEASQNFFTIKEAEFLEYEKRAEQGEVERPTFSLDL
ncbi:hypothetical protein FOL47_001643 [Perkinsus chesapeaki]|uniref:Uncharacterized protein n=1 Tax=Perkinsus chesapeaki TaxID=330153 RepID=A0A7J6N3C1_PERCH|nr:hypothetical protein FOL47_001643 [Perkinsus chesapeaki]